MPAPLFKVEVAFADGPNATAPTYTDISSYVRRDPPLTYSRGNVDETQQLQAGQMSFTVDNTDGRFTVGSSAATSAWGTVLKIRRPVRLSIWDGSAYQVAWTGTVDDWGAGWMGGVKGLSRVTCSDRVATAGRIQLPDLIAGEIRSVLTTGWYFQFAETGSPVSEYFSGATYQVLDNSSDPSATVGYRQDGPGVDESYSLQFSSSTGNSPWITAAGLSTGTITQATVGAWVNAAAINTSAVQRIIRATSGSDFGLYINTLGYITAVVQGTTTGTVIGPPIVDRQWHHVAAVASGGSITLYVDGVNFGSAAYTTNGNSLGNVYIGGYGNTSEGIVSAAIAHPFGTSLALTAQQISNIAAAGSATATETTGSRWNRLCRIAGLSSTWYAADTGGGNLLQQATKGTTLLSALGSVVQTEQGTAFASSAGVLTLKARETRYSRSSSITLAPQTISPGLEFTANDAYLVNSATVQAADGSTAFTTDSTSITDYGTYSTQASVNAPSWAPTAINLSQWLVYRYKTPTARARGLSINGTTKAASITATQLLALDVNSRITLSPLTGPAPSSSVQVFIDGLSGSIADEWEVTYNTSPTTALDGLVLDTSTLDNAASILLY